MDQSQHLIDPSTAIHAVGGRGMEPKVIELPWQTRLRDRWRRLAELRAAIAKAQESYNQQRAQLLALGGEDLEQQVTDSGKTR